MHFVLTFYVRNTGGNRKQHKNDKYAAVCNLTTRCQNIFDTGTWNCASLEI